MTLRRLFILLAASLILGTMLELMSIERYEKNLKSVAETVCDVVQLRAQDGSTRDVYDQVFSFIRKHAPDKSGAVRIRNGAAEFGAQTAGTARDAERLEISCQVENRPDYQIVTSFERHQLMSLSLAKQSSAIFLLLTGLTTILAYLSRHLSFLWSAQILTQVRAELGLTIHQQKNSAFAVWLMRRLLSPFSEVRADILALRHDLDEQKNEAVLAKRQVDTNRSVSARSAAFEEKVRMVQHDLKTPLSVLKILAHTDNAASDLLPHAIRSVEKIVGDLTRSSDGDQLEGLTSLELELIEVALNEAIEDKRLTAQIRLDIEFDFDEEHLSLVRVNSSYLKRSIMNLIQNSIEASEGICKIKISIRRIASTVQIDVADHGTGIPSERIGEIFDRQKSFGKLHGSGLGLFFVKTCFEAWGGSASMVSTDSSGTKFSLVLPICHRLANFQDANCARSCNNLIVVDDEYDLQKSYWLASGRDVKFFDSPHSFINWFESQANNDQFTLVIDLHMRAAVDGLDVIRTLGARERTYLSTSDYLNPEALELAESHKFTIIPKPLFITHLEH